MTPTDDIRTQLAQARRDAINTCHLCDEYGFITGRQHGHDGTLRDAAWRCTHTDEPLPTGFIPDHGARP